MPLNYTHDSDDNWYKMTFAIGKEIRMPISSGHAGAMDVFSKFNRAQALEC